jgi:putative transposase
MRETKDKRLYQRYQCIYLLLSGESHENIAKILNRDIDTICDYVQAYYAAELKGLEMQHSPGRPKRLTSEQEQELYQTIMEKTPVDVGFPVNMNWTRGTRELLNRLGFSYTSPIYKIAKRIPTTRKRLSKNLKG